MRAFFRRALAVVSLVAAAVIVGSVGWHAILNDYAGAWTHAPEDARWLLPASAQALVKAAFVPAGQRPVVDARVDVLGAAPPGQAGHDSRSAPLTWLAERVREHAAGIGDSDNPGAEYLSRLLRQMQAMPGQYRARLWARDAVYDRSGRRDDAATVDYVSNDYVATLSERARQRLAPVVSIHPYRHDATLALARWADKGAQGVAWWPVAQRFDLGDPRAVAFYRHMAERDMTLYLPVGYRRAQSGDYGFIEAATLRAPLAAGVDVVVNVAGARSSEGRSIMPGLFALLRDPALGAHLRISLAGVLAPSKLHSVLEALLQHPQFYSHLAYASSYPQPAIAAATSLAALADSGFIDRDRVEPLRAIYDVNPLLFAFVALRQVHLPATDLRLPDTVFFGGNG